MKNIKKNIEKINSLLDEMTRYEDYKEKLASRMDLLFSQYQQKKYTHEQYTHRMKLLLEGKTKDEWNSYYAAYNYSLLKQIEEINYEIFYEAYANKDFESIKPIIKPTIKPESQKQSVRQDLTIRKDEKSHETRMAKLITDKHEDPKQARKDKQVFDALVQAEKQEQKKIAELEQKKTIQQERNKKELKEKDLREKALREKLKIPHPPQGVSASRDAVKKALSSQLKLSNQLPAPQGKKTSIPDKFKKKNSTIGVGGTFGYVFVKNMLKRFSEVKKEDKGKTLLDLKLRSKDESPLFEKQDNSGFSSSVINEEAKRIKNILEGRPTPNIYQPSFFGAIANIMIKRVSFYLLDTFPDIFKALYNALRLANIRILSNTYVNIMVLFVFIASFITAPATFFFLIGKYGAIQAITKTIFMTLIAAATTATAFYAYPFIKIKDRRRNLNSNLPFAINHMAAVASSGVPPTRMFQLIADSPEYGEVSIEVAKIVEYIELFGYDFLTALKSVAAISPSPSFKDFLEGLVSTIESGGDIKSYLADKAEEAMLTYELERQKYLESISTYSDIYSVILIAAPLFFVTTLSMVSMLGGSIGGLDVNTVVFVGTYVIVPLLNVGFLMFLGMVQPEV